MSSKENLKDALKRSNRKLLELRKENENLQEEIDILTLRLKADKIHCELYHKDKTELCLHLIDEMWTQRPTGVCKRYYKKKKKKARMFKASRINSRNNAKK